MSDSDLIALAASAAVICVALLAELLWQVKKILKAVQKP